MKTKHPAVILARQVLRALWDVDESLKIANCFGSAIFDRLSFDSLPQVSLR